MKKDKKKIVFLSAFECTNVPVCVCVRMCVCTLSTTYY